jgi:hypothetical protein
VNLLRHSRVESLEVRTLLAVTVDAQGWTDFTRGDDARTIFVSSSIGNDKFRGLSPKKPVRTLAKARSILRDGLRATATTTPATCSTA